MKAKPRLLLASSPSAPIPIIMQRTDIKLTALQEADVCLTAGGTVMW